MSAVFAAAARLQELVPEAVLVGGTAAVHHAGHRVSLDDGHVVADLRERFDDVLAALEETSGWVTARVQRPVLILGKTGWGGNRGSESDPPDPARSRGGCRGESRPAGADAPRDRAHQGVAVSAPQCHPRLSRFRRLGGPARRSTYRSRGRGRWIATTPINSVPDGRRVATQVARQLAEPRPDDLGEVDLISYRRLDRRWHDWQTVVDVCRRVAVRVLDRLVEEAE